jgi:hypothetical protein
MEGAWGLLRVTGHFSLYKKELSGVEGLPPKSRFPTGLVRRRAPKADNVGPGSGSAATAAERDRHPVLCLALHETGVSHGIELPPEEISVPALFIKRPFLGIRRISATAFGDLKIRCGSTLHGDSHESTCLFRARFC